MFVRVAFRPGFPEAAESNETFSAIAKAAGDAMYEQNPGTQVHTALEPREGEPVILKRRVSAFAGSDLDVLLRAARAERLVLAAPISGVVLSTLRQAADLDFRLDGAVRRVRRPGRGGAPRAHGEGLPPSGRGHHGRRVGLDPLVNAERRRPGAAPRTGRR